MKVGKLPAPKIIKSLPKGVVFAIRTEMPFTEAAGDVTERRQHFRNGDASSR
jgi:hypothetical protein